MQAKPRVVRIYRLPSGREPFSDWLKSLKDRQGRAAIEARLARLRVGNLGDYRRLAADLCEMRIHAGPGYRVYFGDVGNEVAILLWGGDKGTQQRDIQKAKQYWDEFKSRSKDE
jgi:putative addiction module killer protein